MNNEEDEGECVVAYQTMSELIDLRPAITKIQRIMIVSREDTLKVHHWHNRVAKYFGRDPQDKHLRELFDVGAWCYERGGKLAMRTVSYRVVQTVEPLQAKALVKAFINETWKGLYERAP
jgi:hypothetical protein